MCGIAGLVRVSHPFTRDEALTAIQPMVEALRQRGPDDSGCWFDLKAGVALGHRRLSVIDLSAEGHQPMCSPDHRFCLVYNGEIYNYKAVRAELEALGHAFRGHSDTEVALAAISQWGVGSALRRFTGMFAFGVWDVEQRALHLARDRLGEKPLYYGWSGNTFVFGSELKALRAYPAWQGEIDRESVALYLKFGYVPSPSSIYQRVYKLPPASFLSLSWRELSQQELAPVNTYWSFSKGSHSPAGNHHPHPPEEAISSLDRLLRDVVAGQMISDVPLGAFLSGGIDSSTIVALMQAQSPRRIRTFTIGFHETGYNEASHAKSIADHLGTEHTELYMSGQGALDIIPSLPAIYDEPFADPSQIPTAFLCALTRRHVTVALSGDGGDELFGGYKRYLWTQRLWNATRICPGSARKAVKALVQAVPVRVWNRMLAPLALLAAPLGSRPGDRLYKLSEAFSASSAGSMYLNWLTLWTEPGLVVGLDSASLKEADQPFVSNADLLQAMMVSDTVSYLPDDILVKVDRASMAVSLEVRVPLLDHRVVEFANLLPVRMKYRSSQSKWILRQLLRQYVPPALVQRPKMGFAAPLEHWLRGPLRGWADDLINVGRLRAQGLLAPEPIQRKWHEHLRGERNWGNHLWDILMLQAWLEHHQELN